MKALLIFFTLIGTLALSAQHIGYLIPAGGKQGTTVEVQVGGQNYWSLNGAWVSGKGVTVEQFTVVPGFPHPAWKQRKFLQQWLRNVQDGKTEVPERPSDPEATKDWRKHKYYDAVDQISPLQRHLMTEFLFIPQNPLQMSPSINSVVIVKLNIAPDAPLGRRELRLVRGDNRVSNPLPFYVDDIAGIREPFMPVPPKKRETPSFMIPSVLNGQILPGSKDIWNFSAKKGEQLTFRAYARCMIPFMGDCVPGYFQCVIEVRNLKNELLAFADDNGNDPDPLLNWTVPADGKYQLIVRDALYRGRADFVYRITVRKGIENFKLAEVTKYKDLPRRELKDLPSNRKIDYPVLIHGCIQPRTVEKFIVRAQKGDQLVGEVFARRLNSKLDSLLRVLGPDGKQIAFNDDFLRPNISPVMQNTDSFLCFTAPSDGEYTFLLSDTSSNGGPSHQYQLRIDKPRPSFTIHFSPSAVPAAINGNTLLKLNIVPHEGFNQDIEFYLDSPHGYWISGSKIIPAGSKNTSITLGCAYEEDVRRRGPVQAKLIARAGNIIGSVIAGDETTQAFAYTHAVPSGDFLLSRTWAPAGASLVWFIEQDFNRISLKPGTTAELKLGRRKLPKDTSLRFELKGAPKGLSICKTEIVKTYKNGFADITLTLKADPQMKHERFNLPVTVYYHYKSQDRKTKKWHNRVSEFVMPALLFEIGD